MGRPGLRLEMLLSLLLLAIAPAHAGSLEHRRIDTLSLQGNASGLPTSRNITIYLPEGYASGARRFAVIYYLSGFFEDDRAPYADHDAKALFDQAIERHVIDDMIVVTADFTTPAGGSWYVNSAATGNWEDLMVRELVPWVDAHYRTLACRDARGIAGDRMGGHGAIGSACVIPTFSGRFMRSIRSAWVRACNRCSRDLTGNCWLRPGRSTMSGEMAIR
jgi:enterochelin esterase-like enzyme